MQVAESALDVAASRGALSRVATLIDEHRAANPACDGTAEELEALFVEAQERSPSRAGAATPTAARSPAPTATSKLAPSCTRSALTARTTTSPTSPPANSRRSTGFGTGVAIVVAAPDDMQPV